MMGVCRFSARLLPASLTLLVLFAPGESRADHSEEAALLATLASAKVPSDDPSLLAYFRTRTITQDKAAFLAGCVKLLASDEYPARVKATADLITAGRSSLTFVRPALIDPDKEVARRARWVVEAVDSEADTQITLAAAQLLQVRRPSGAAEVLLNYLPFAQEPVVEYTALETLVHVGMFHGKPDPCILQAVKGSYPLQRSAAGWLLGRSPFIEVRNRAIPLLNDPDATVRFRTAEGLLTGKDRRGLPALVALLGNGPEELAAQAESVLLHVAGANGPAVTLGNDAVSRRQCRDVWKAWWKEYGDEIDLKKLDLERRQLGLRLVVVLNGYGGQGAVWEYGADHKTRWELKNVGRPFDTRVLPGGRLLVGEYEGQRVTERDMTGKVLWEQKMPGGVLEVQRLGNGNTLIATNYNITEVTKAGKTVFTHAEPAGDIFSAQRLANGNLLYGLYSGSVVELNRAGKEVNRFSIERQSQGLVNIEVLPNGRYLIPLIGSNRIAEFDRTGKIHWQVSVPTPTSVAVLPGGHLLVGSHRLSSLREINREGKVLWEKKTEGQVFRVRTR